MEEQFREVIPRHLAAVGVRSKDVRCPDIRVVDLGDLLGQRVPKELQEPHLLSNILCGCRGSSQRFLEAAQGGRWLGGCSRRASLGCLNIWRTWNTTAWPESGLTLLGTTGELSRSEVDCRD